MPDLKFENIFASRTVNNNIDNFGYKTFQDFVWNSSYLNLHASLKGKLLSLSCAFIICLGLSCIMQINDSLIDWIKNIYVIFIPHYC